VAYLAVAGGYAGDWCYTLDKFFYLTLYVRMVITTTGVNTINTPLQSFVALVKPKK
jgi:hypothetical protein